MERENAKSIVGRTPQKRDEILLQLRQRISSGELSAGSRLPTRVELCEQFRTGNTTVQAALSALEQEGFVESRGPRGTFVRPAPPSTHQFGLVFPETRDYLNNQNGWSRYFKTLEDMSRAITRQGTYRFVRYYMPNPGVPNKLSPSDSYMNLLDDVTSLRLAGLIFAAPSHLLAHTPIMRQGVPMIYLTNSPNPLQGPRVHLDMRQWLTQALEHLRGRGCQRVASLSMGAMTSELATHFEQELQRLQMHCPEHMQQITSHRLVGSAKRMTHLMFAAPDASQRPEGLLVMDDHLIAEASQGLVDAGLRGADVPPVVSVTNFPSLPPTSVPTHWLGFDLGAALGQALQLAQALRVAGGAKNIQEERLIEPVEQDAFQRTGFLQGVSA